MHRKEVKNQINRENAEYFLKADADREDSISKSMLEFGREVFWFTHISSFGKRDGLIQFKNCEENVLFAGLLVWK